jgi:hypothetical protein
MIKNAIYNSKSLFLLTLVVIFGFSGFALANQGDIDKDGYANLMDLSLFADQWLETGCSSDPASNWCDGADINHSGNVDFNDFALFAQNWSPTAPIWSEEFDGTTVDTSKWTILNEADGSDSWYLPANVTVSGGTLKIANKEESAPNGGHWTGGHIDATYYHPQYKYLVARVRHSAPDIYIWATWWTVGWTGSTWQWPPEMDICEVQGGPGKSPGQTYWYNYAGIIGDSGNTNTYNGTINTGMDESQWHTYGMYWNATSTPIFYVDGVISGSPVSPYEGDHGSLMAAKLKLNSSPNSQNRVHNCPLGNMEVDYVRVYDLPPAQTVTQHLALNKPVTVSSAKYSGGAGERAVDESSSATRWESNWYDPQWIRVDLQATCSITQVKINWQHAAGRDYKIQVSDEPNGPWTDCVSVTYNYVTGWRTYDFLPAKTGRYIQLLGTVRTTAYGYSLYDMQVNGTVIDPNHPDPPARTNLALGKTATCSSVESGLYTADKAFDGNLTSRWSSGFSDPQWICVDLGATYNIDTVKLYWQTSAGKTYTIDTADNPAGPWTTRASVVNGTYGLKIHEFAPVSCRYVRMYGTARTWVYGYSLYEMEVY